ncbi:unnamed protein product, partial [Ectocarpus fasciculatus]
ARRGVLGLHLLRLVDRGHEDLPRGELRNRVWGLRPSHSPMVCGCFEWPEGRRDCRGHQRVDGRKWE